MPLVNMADMLQHAHRHGYAVGAFDLVDLEFLQAIMAAAEKCRAPVILSVAESHFEYFDLDLLMPAVEAAARRARIPVAVHLDHGASLESAVRAIRLGCNGVMVDASHLDLGQNIHATREVVKTAHACGVPVEGELGYVPGVEGEDAERHPGEIRYTSVAEARAYVEKTGVDFLAVSVGTVHGRMTGRPKLDFSRLRQINEALGVPLVIHGGTGLSEEQYRRLITNGVAKINYYTALADAARKALKSAMNGRNGAGYAAAKERVRAMVAEEAARCMRWWGSAGRSAEVLEQCRLWRAVEHVILYNVEALPEGGVEDMMAEGRRVLGAIPGVREVVTGRSLDPESRYRYAWLIRFCHSQVVASYRDHPAHQAFANERFRPVAGDRIRIDFESVEDPPNPSAGDVASRRVAGQSTSSTSS